ncbi:hypothetical protein WJX73_005715 [Symbiochloris irregularis]|uniref:Nudix hydrolase domain-containing protein n=1 Tax=Symbiochloris irregularis TaxID=706552 RepID=A0AAW1P1R8_9CHLO
MASTGAQGKFELLSEKQIHQRYLTLYNRTVRFPAREEQPEAVHEFDVVGHPQSDFQFAVTFPFHPHGRGRKGGQVTVLREYCSGVNDMMWVLPTGGFSPKRHLNCLECAKAEMSEEAHLEGGDWHPLTPAGHPGIPEVKWCANRFTPYLCIDPQEAAVPGARDAEEVIECTWDRGHESPTYLWLEVDL